MSNFDEYRFRLQVDTALTSVRKVLDSSRHPSYPADTPHKYDDKYALAEFLTNLGIAAELNCLEELGVDSAKLAQMRSWATGGRSVTLRLASTESCSFNRTDVRDVESPHSVVTEKTKGGVASKKSTKVVTTVTEHFYDVNITWELFAFEGTDPSMESSRLVLTSRTGQCEIKTSNNQPTPPARQPRPETLVQPAVDCNVTWLLKNMGDDMQLCFKIDRENEKCRTPRRNEEVEKALAFFGSFSNWCSRTDAYLRRTSTVAPGRGSDMDAVTAQGLFVPVVPLFECNAAGIGSAQQLEGGAGAAPTSAGLVSLPAEIAVTEGDMPGPLLPVADINIFLQEQKRSIGEKQGALAASFPARDAAVLTSVTEASVMVMMKHGSAIATHLLDGMGYIEDMLTQQLIGAIGKVVGSADFDDYMRYHNAKILQPQFRPQPFCYSIRRPDHFPDGTLSIEMGGGRGSSKQSAYTTVASLPNAQPMSFAINAATRVQFSGERRLHALVAQQFGHEAPAPLTLVARARQFSSFMLLVGKIDGPDSFEPQHAIILQNKDELTIPLLLEQLPTPKAFRDAIESLSPEQQRFAKAFREMQLASSVFGVCVIQLKPQLEKLLRLPDDSLTKEIKLTQDLLSLFIEYQIPSDLLTFEAEDGEWEDVSDSGEAAVAASGGGGRAAVAQVKGHVAAVRAMIKESEDAELAEQARKAELQKKRAEEEKAARQATAMAQEQQMMACSMAPPPPGAPMSRSMAMAAPMRSMAAPMQKSAQAGGAAPALAPAPAPPATQPQPAPESLQPSEGDPVSALDFTAIPAQLDAKFEQLDTDAALRPTTIKAGPSWTKQSQPSLLGKKQTLQCLNGSEQDSEQNKAFDLLDALSRSGALPIECASLHVIVAATHRFDKTLMETVIQDNVSPIEKLERSSLIVASTVHGRPAAELLQASQVARIEGVSPMLFASDD